MTDDTQTPPPSGEAPGAVPPAPLTLGRPPPPSVRRSRFSVSLIWLVPAVALLLGLSMVIQAWTSSGPRIEIAFQTAEGLEAGKTHVRFKNVVIGIVKAIRLAEDRSHIVVVVDLAKEATSFAKAETRFWVVRPRVGATGVSGIDTLLSGAFIGADAGKSEESQKSFVGLETPPPITYGAAGRQFSLRADDLGSLDIGSPVYYRRVQVGRVVSSALDKDGRGVDLQVFIEAPHDKLVTRYTRFWNASGIDIALGANGLKVDTESLATLLAGGIAFQMPPGVWETAPAPENTIFQLSNDRRTALVPPDGEPLFITMRFDQSLRGLTLDAPVEFHGIDFGKVVGINVDFDEAKKSFPTVVSAIVYPRRLGAAYDKLVPPSTEADAYEHTRVVGRLIEQGLRAQARSGNLLTGQLYIALDFVKGAPKVAFDPQILPLDVPTVPGAFDKLQEQVARIADKMDKIPFDSIGNKLDGSLTELDKTLRHVNGELLPEARTTLQGLQKSLAQVDATVNAAGRVFQQDSPLQQGLEQTLKDLQRASTSMRALTDYVARHPESLLRGRPVSPGLPSDDAAPAAPSPATSPATPPTSGAR